MKRLFWILTNRCSLRCKYCYYNTGLEDRKFQEFKYSPCQIDELIEEISRQFNYVILTGGEPLLHPHVFDIIKKCKAKKLQVSLLTNGTLLDEKICTELVKLNVDNISISLDSLDPNLNDLQRGKTAQIVKGIEILSRLRGKAQRIEILQTVTKNTVDSIPAVHKFCRENNFNHWINPVDLPTTASCYKEFSLEHLNKAELKELSAQLRTWSDSNISPGNLDNYVENFKSLVKKEIPIKCKCKMGDTHFVLDVDGNVYPCFSRKDVEYGNIYKAKLTEILNEAKTHKSKKELAAAKCVSLGCLCLTEL